MTRLPTSIDLPRFVRTFAVSFACVTMLVSVHAMAEPTAAERSLAAALFDQGRTLMSEGKLDEACSKLAESQRLDPGGGTLLNLALCHERQGKIATAWTEFREARAIAKKDGRADREGAADTEIKKLEPLLTRVSVVVPAEAKVAGLTVEIDGVPVPEAGWATPFAIDPGTHAVAAKAPGYREWRSSIEIGNTGGSANVNVPSLEKDAGASSSPGPSASATSSAPKAPPIASSSAVTGPDVPKSSMRTAGFVVGGLGLALVGAGAITGGLAIQKNKEINDQCDDNTHLCPTQAGVDLSSDALTLAHVSTATFGVGIAGVVVGTILIVAAPKSTPGKVSLSVGPQSISVTGRF
jgi:hypothetical protein